MEGFPGHIAMTVIWIEFFIISCHLFIGTACAGLIRNPVMGSSLAKLRVEPYRILMKKTIRSELTLLNPQVFFRLRFLIYKFRPPSCAGVNPVDHLGFLPAIPGKRADGRIPPFSHYPGITRGSAAGSTTGGQTKCLNQQGWWQWPR